MPILYEIDIKRETEELYRMEILIAQISISLEKKWKRIKQVVHWLRSG